MKHSDFVHLHLHTEYSLLDGAFRVSDVVEKARACKKITSLSVGRVFGEAIRRIHDADSLSSLFVYAPASCGSPHAVFGGT